MLIINPYGGHKQLVVKQGVFTMALTLEQMCEKMLAAAKSQGFSPSDLSLSTINLIYSKPTDTVALWVDKINDGGFCTWLKVDRIEWNIKKHSSYSLGIDLNKKQVCLGFHQEGEDYRHASFSNHSEIDELLDSALKERDEITLQLQLLREEVASWGAVPDYSDSLVNNPTGGCESAAREIEPDFPSRAATPILDAVELLWNPSGEQREAKRQALIVRSFDLART